MRDAIRLARISSLRRTTEDVNWLRTGDTDYANKYLYIPRLAACACRFHSAFPALSSWLADPRTIWYCAVLRASSISDTR